MIVCPHCLRLRQPAGLHICVPAMASSRRLDISKLIIDVWRDQRRAEPLRITVLKTGAKA